MVFSDGEIIDEAGRSCSNSSVLESYGVGRESLFDLPARAFEMLLKQNFVNGAAAAIRRPAAQAALPLPCDMPHDYWLAIWCSLHGGIVAIPERLYSYRQHSRNVIGIAQKHPLYVLAGLWRHPTAPRERELRIWSAVTQCIAAFSGPEQLDAARRKLDWLVRVVPARENRLLRCLEITRSAMAGNYKRYSPKHALLRDVISLIK
jgi:hypothetical protein